MDLKYFQSPLPLSAWFLTENCVRFRTTIGKRTEKPPTKELVNFNKYIWTKKASFSHWVLQTKEQCLFNSLMFKCRLLKPQLAIVHRNLPQATGQITRVYPKISQFTKLRQRYFYKLITRRSSVQIWPPQPHWNPWGCRLWGFCSFDKKYVKNSICGLFVAYCNKNLSETVRIYER